MNDDQVVKADFKADMRVARLASVLLDAIKYRTQNGIATKIEQYVHLTEQEAKDLAQHLSPECDLKIKLYEPASHISGRHEYQVIVSLKK